MRPQEVDLQLLDVTYVRARERNAARWQVTFHCIFNLAEDACQEDNNHAQDPIFRLIWNVQVKCGDPGADALIAQKVQTVCAWADKNPGKRTKVPQAFLYTFVSACLLCHKNTTIVVVLCRDTSEVNAVNNAF